MSPVDFLCFQNPPVVGDGVFKRNIPCKASQKSYHGFRYYKSRNTKRVSPDFREGCIHFKNSYIEVLYLVKNYYCPFEASLICLECNHSKLNEVIINFQFYDALLEIRLLSRLFLLHDIIQKHHVEIP